jgi:hypothetical protein
MVRCALMASSAHNKRSTGGWYNNRWHLDRGREKSASSTDGGFSMALRLHSRQKRAGFPSPGTACVSAYRDT